MVRYRKMAMVLGNASRTMYIYPSTTVKTYILHPYDPLITCLYCASPQDDQNLLVPIHAYPVMNTAKFPSNVRFPTTPVGRTRNKTLTLECDVPVDFEFQLAVLQHHPAFVITPMRGFYTDTKLMMLFYCHMS